MLSSMYKQARIIDDLHTERIQFNVKYSLKRMEK